VTPTRTTDTDPALVIDRLPRRAIPAIIRELELAYPGARVTDTGRITNARGEVRIAGLGKSERFAAVELADKIAEGIR
jgi:hypothetical protein